MTDSTGRQLDETRREMNALFSKMVRYIAELKAENAALKKSGLSAHASMYWDASRPDVTYDSVSEAMDDYCSGEIVEIGRAAALPPLYAVRVPIDDGDEIDQYDDLETAQSMVAEVFGQTPTEKEST